MHISLQMTLEFSAVRHRCHINSYIQVSDWSLASSRMKTRRFLSLDRMPYVIPFHSTSAIIWECTSKHQTIHEPTFQAKERSLTTLSLSFVCFLSIVATDANTDHRKIHTEESASPEPSSPHKENLDNPVSQHSITAVRENLTLQHDNANRLLWNRAWNSFLAHKAYISYLTSILANKLLPSLELPHQSLKIHTCSLLNSSVFLISSPQRAFFMNVTSVLATQQIAAQNYHHLKPHTAAI